MVGAASRSNCLVTPLPSISFGTDLRRPDLLETRPTQDLLLGIRDGHWQDAVNRVRSLPTNSAEQKAAKIQLPFCTWAGVFTQRRNSGLVQHAGQCGVDLDGLGETGAIAVLQTAVADPFCLAAFRSTRGEGVRLIFRIPQCSSEQHFAAFEQVAAHVRKIYNHEPDISGRDVGRASFVSFDRGLWLNVGAKTLPILFATETQRFTSSYRCVSPPLYGGMLAETCWSWFGRNHASAIPRVNGIGKTHFNLLDLGKAIAIHAHKVNSPLTPAIIDIAFDAWRNELVRNDVQLRCAPENYKTELITSVQGCVVKPWFKAAVEKWQRWARHKEFPIDGLPDEKILFAIRKHCWESKNREFYLGVRDAGLIAGVGYVTAWRMLRKLVTLGYLVKIGKPLHARHSQTYRLLKP